MRPGKMRHVITVQRLTAAPNEYGTEVSTWADLARLRAELVEAKDETAATPGAGKGVAFKTRVFGGITLQDRVIWRGDTLRIVALTDPDFAEGRGIVLTCEGEA